MKERDFLAWLKAEQSVLETTASENGKAQAVIQTVITKYEIEFSEKLKLRALHEVIQDCLYDEGLSIDDLKGCAHNQTEKKYRVIRNIFQQIPGPMPQAALADILCISPSVVSKAINYRRKHF